MQMDGWMDGWMDGGYIFVERDRQIDLIVTRFSPHHQ